MFENSTPRNVQVNKWRTITDGPMALVKLRGPDQLQTRLGQVLFLAIRSQNGEFVSFSPSTMELRDKH